MFSLAELKQAIRERLNWLNNRPRLDCEYSRQELIPKLEKQALQPLTDSHPLLDVLNDRYGRQSTMWLATQFPVSTWHARLPDPALADALLDRLVHNAHRIELKEESQRKLRADGTMSSS